MSDNVNSNNDSDAKEKQGAGSDDWPVIFSYSRAQFIADGGLVEVSKAVAERYFKCHIGITKEVWDACVSNRSEPNAYRDGERLRALLCDAVHVARRSGAGTLMPWTYTCVPATAFGTTAQDFELLLHIGPGDHQELVVTIMFPSQR